MKRWTKKKVGNKRIIHITECEWAGTVSVWRRRWCVDALMRFMCWRIVRVSWRAVEDGMVWSGFPLLVCFFCLSFFFFFVACDFFFDFFFLLFAVVVATRRVVLVFQYSMICYRGTYLLLIVRVVLFLFFTDPMCWSSSKRHRKLGISQNRAAWKRRNHSSRCSLSNRQLFSFDFNNVTAYQGRY